MANRACFHVFVQDGDGDCVCVKCSGRATVQEVQEWLGRLAPEEQVKSLLERIKTDKPPRLSISNEPL